MPKLEINRGRQYEHQITEVFTLDSPQKQERNLIAKEENVLRRSRSFSNKWTTKVERKQVKVLKLQNGMELEVELMAGGEPNAMRILRLRAPKS